MTLWVGIARRLTRQRLEFPLFLKATHKESIFFVDTDVMQRA
jgi:hypothetical protein